jgi:hypothetical protein
MFCGMAVTPQIEPNFNAGGPDRKAATETSFLFTLQNLHGLPARQFTLKSETRRRYGSPWLRLPRLCHITVPPALACTRLRACTRRKPWNTVVTGAELFTVGHEITVFELQGLRAHHFQRFQ